MGFGDSTAFAGSTGGVKTQGMCQGNCATPSAWTVTSIAIIQAHKRKRHDIHLKCQITRTSLHLAGTLFVDDTDIEHFKMNRCKMVWEAHNALQRSIINWGRLLIATAGALKPSKCFFHMISFLWNDNGMWRYDNNDQLLGMRMSVPIADGSTSPIEHFLVMTPTKTLGQTTCPIGSSNGAIGQMKEKSKKWINKAKSSKLHERNLRFLLDKKFWMAVPFGISSITAPFAVQEECLMQLYYNILSMSGIPQLVNRLIRQMDRGFYGNGFPHPGIECLTWQINKLLTHYGCSLDLGQWGLG